MKKKPVVWWKLIVGWSIGALVLGLMGAQLSIKLGAPGYFGGAMGFVLTGMVAMFVFAAKIAQR